MKKKVNVGVFSFTCDEGCSITFLEILNKKFFEWKDFIEFKHFRLIQSKSEVKNLDIAFVEGAISTKEEIKKIKKIRKVSKKLILIGSCAISGSPSNLRNFFDKERKKEIQPILKKFGHEKKVLAVKDVVKADKEIPGCPIDENKFIEVMEKTLKEFGVKLAS
ncbi:MAG: hypothetical protein NZ942_02365 [Candidatus Aenigmarchaeota archaeon]|nr:hypothetical protein [Candidatus Aenigmarchaeota archaeon]